MFYFEILNKVTLEKAEGYANTMAEICQSLDWRPQDCRCIYRAKAEGAE